LGLRALFLAGAAGTALELLLLGHTEGAWQLIPVVLLAASCLCSAAIFVKPLPFVVGVFRVAMIACIASGAVGVCLHYWGNTQFELELQPDVAGFGLFGQAMTGATPVLAPGTMALLGAIGLLSVHGPRSPQA
jgi:hypothetical protein